MASEAPLQQDNNLVTATKEQKADKADVKIVEQPNGAGDAPAANGKEAVKAVVEEIKEQKSNGTENGDAKAKEECDDKAKEAPKRSADDKAEEEDVEEVKKAKVDETAEPKKEAATEETKEEVTA